jgi:uncharacterized pyridoxamine 5'-phosphate oxidase family protein
MEEEKLYFLCTETERRFLNRLKNIGEINISGDIVTQNSFLDHIEFEDIYLEKIFRVAN